MTVDLPAASTKSLGSTVEGVASGYVGLPFEQRYAEVSAGFAEWLLAEPIRFPADHSTFGWACAVPGCAASLADTAAKWRLCHAHEREYRSVSSSMPFDEFTVQASSKSARTSWALQRNEACRICGPQREQIGHGYCQTHLNTMQRWLRDGGDLSEWIGRQVPLAPYLPCSVPACVHDGSLTTFPGKGSARLCPSHGAAWRAYTKAHSIERNHASWTQWSTDAKLTGGVRSVEDKGLVSTSHLPVRLQRELRYAIHRYASFPRRAQWRPRNVQVAVDALAAAGIETFADPAVAAVELPNDRVRSDLIRRLLYSLPTAARSLTVTEQDARDAGWFDPVIVGAEPFPDGTRRPIRRKYWDLTDISQLWLRDLLWDHLRHCALGAAGKRPSQANVYQRISSIRLLSKALRQLREDEGEDPSQLGTSDAKAFKELWDLWHREQLLVVDRFTTNPPTSHPITGPMHVSCMNMIRDILHFGRCQELLDGWADSFVMALPRYQRKIPKPQPRPLSDDDFRRLVSDDALTRLDAADVSGVGFTDIWLTHAFQGGRISETLQLRLGCIGTVGTQPYLWRDMSKVGVLDYGMPCHWPVYERIQRRQDLTRSKLRTRYAKELAELDDAGRAALEKQWDDTMPLFPGAVTNPDLALPISQHHFTKTFTDWIKEIGLKGVTTHRTRATLATALLANGAPPALVRQLLGHFSERTLAHYARFGDDQLIQSLQQVWTAGPGMDKPGTTLLTPDAAANLGSKTALAERIDLSIVPVEHGLCRYGPVVGGKACPFKKNCSRGPQGPCPHFVITGADLAYWERKRDAAYHFAEAAPSDEAREYILSEWQPWEAVLDGLRQTLDEVGLLKAAEELDLRSPLHDFFHPLFATGWTLANQATDQHEEREDQSA